jgi:hypothetical protein
MPKGYGGKQGEDEEVVTTPPETVGPVTVVTETPGKTEEAPVDHTGMIQVRGAGSDNKVVLWEVDVRHPKRQAWVVNDGKVVWVFPTAEVNRKIKDGTILRVNWNS